VLGQAEWFAKRASSHTFLTAGFVTVGVLLCGGIVLARLGRLFPSASISVLSWAILGTLGAGIAEQPRPADYVLSLVEARRLNLKTPLRWHGRLRDEPARLPWGYGYEIELTGVENQGSFEHVSAGLRLSFSESQEHAGAPDVHAGDEIVVATEAKRPQVFRDEGTFDRRACLEQQNIDLVATLRAPKLMERTAASRTSAVTLLARARRRLRDEIDTLFATKPEVGGVLRAMLLGDRSFVDRAESTDFQKTGESAILDENSETALRADVLKVGHHGSKNSTMAGFLQPYARASQ
jgi:predicted membrane metal-binding protein